jgi:integrase
MSWKSKRCGFFWGRWAFERGQWLLGMALGLRCGELAGLKWEDVNFEKLHLNVTRSVVDQQIGNTKTEVSRKPVPIDDYLAQDLLAWRAGRVLGQ